MFKLFQSKIERLSDKRKKLTEKREKTIHRYQELNADISTKITKLQNQSFENDDKVEKITKQLNFKIDRVLKEIEAEKEYVDAVTLDEQDEYLKDHQKAEIKAKRK